MSVRSRSKFLSLVLRHDPGRIGIVLDEAGWTDVAGLLEACARHGMALTRAQLAEVVATSDKQRFALSDDGLRIRANQGHSVDVDLGLPASLPPDLLYHGTVDAALPGIRDAGLLRRARHHVHLSSDLDTARKVGGRRGQPVVLVVRAGAMAAAGHRFYRSANGVWLVDAVPPEFIELPGATPPLDLDALRRAVAEGATFRYRYFWGHSPRPDGRLSDSVFSQWWPCRFEVDGSAYVTAEQFMMAGKARLFGDAEALAAILATADPAACKALGRGVRGFDEAAWGAARFDLVVRGNVAKFGQDDALRAYLLATGDEVIVEASPRDRIWGIGLGRDNPLARHPHTWRGRNLLGFALVRTRAILRGDLPRV